MLQIDEKIDQTRLQQFASQTQAMPAQVRHFMAEGFKSDETPEFYAGLTAGLAAAYQLSALENGRQFIGAALATSAEQTIRSTIPA